MNSSRPSHSVKLIELLANYSSFFGITPWYSFKNSKLVYTRTFKYYSVFLTVVVTVLSLGLTVGRFFVVYPDTPPNFVVENVALEVAGVLLFLVTVLGSSTWNVFTWERLFKEIQKFELIYRRGKGKGPTIKHGILVFATGNIYLIILFILDFGHYSKSTLTTGRPGYFVSILIFRYTEFVTSLFIFAISIIIKANYEEINWILKRNHNASRGTAPNVIKTVKILYMGMYLFTEIFNKLFGWPILLIFFYSMVQVLDCLSFVSPMRNTDNIFEHRFQLSVHLFYALEIIVWLTAIVFCCDSVVKEAEELLTNCYVLEQSLPLIPKETEELLNLKRLIKDNRPKFTAAGFFEIRRSTLLSLLGTITTYFIVAMQFNSKST